MKGVQTLPYVPGQRLSQAPAVTDYPFFRFSQQASLVIAALCLQFFFIKLSPYLAVN